MVFDRFGKRLGTRPVLLEGGVAAARAPAFACELLDEKTARAPWPSPSARFARAIVPRHGKSDEGRELLGLTEISVCRLSQALAFQWYDALVTLGVVAAVDGHGEMALAEKRPVWRKFIFWLRAPCAAWPARPCCREARRRGTRQGS